ncbi:S-adenosylmethionine:tRNA-ribosyltransferase-isomerase (queuine synthetase) [Methylobacterium sp. PvP062]|uniref:S-adenosylmethionine:tRNA-ribosyltransferase-isomerase (Queuine synthetase) n=1 Tax=Methylobacterium radiotolerans TaxID=31998 RepID=A0ABV2NUX3_9HYPH|nr:MULTISPECIES: hypothetical protein [unclassified Methylobacterium]MBP2498265.1 S-adenosylmethionine:tRNA-ribosyltransferase-isomerase (queuine synthetase) [Methylobacterium sp. PvP105]MBP2505649.1 S-adenosylmethionine:tRNA-ribosyltransferase-isomerase (queuine synthetase) [Methylobacterium sp. PvP109]
MTTVVLIRPTGPATNVQAQGTHFVETSLEQLVVKASARSVLLTLSVGALILEDLRLEDMPEHVRKAVVGATLGQSCPIVTRWTSPRTGDAR